MDVKKAMKSILFALVGLAWIVTLPLWLPICAICMLFLALIDVGEHIVSAMKRTKKPNVFFWRQ